MKTTRLITIASIICLMALPALGLAQKHPSDLPEPKEISFTPPKPVEFTLTNGIRVFYMQDRELPLIAVHGRLRAGSLGEPAEKAGLASLTGEVLRSGGSITLPGDKIDEELEFLAARVDSSMDDEFASVGANCLKEDFARVLEILADIVMHPAFPVEKINLAKNQRKEAIRRRWDQPASVAGILFTEQMFGGTPYGARSTWKTLNNITRDDLVAFHQRYYAPGNFYLSIVGDISQQAAKAMLQKAFANWEKKEVTLPDVAPLVEKADGKIYYAYRDTPQANVVLGHLGIRRNDPDERKIEVMNQIFGGGGFTARLMREIRSNRGLTYGIYGRVSSDKDRGVFRISSQLKADRCAEAIGLVKDIIKDMQNRPVTEEELAVAKKYLINSFVFRFDSLEQVATQYMELQLTGYPKDYLDRYIETIKAVTREDVQAMAKKYMDPAKMILVVVGDEKKFDQSLATLGTVQPVDYKKLAESDRSE